MEKGDKAARAPKAPQKEAYVFAEEFMEPFGALIGLPAAQGCLTQEMFGVDIGAAETCTLYFAEEEGGRNSRRNCRNYGIWLCPFAISDGRRGFC